MIVPANPRSVLIVKPSSLGDVVTAVPVLRGLRRSFPGARLAWLVSTSCAALLADDADLDEVIPFDREGLGPWWRRPAAARKLLALARKLRRAEFDWAIDLQGLFRSGFFTRATRAPLRAGFADAREGAALFYNRRVAVAAAHTIARNVELARALGVDAREADMTLKVPAAGREFAEGLCRQHSWQARRFLVCVPPARWPTKRYPVRHWRTVVRALGARAPVVLLGAPGDEACCGQIADGIDGVVNLAGQTGIGQMMGLIAASAGVICSDSAAKFISPAVGVDAVVLIGPTRLERTGPVGASRAIAADVPCQGCLKRRCRHTTCMELIDPAEVAAAADDLLAERSR